MADKKKQERLRKYRREYYREWREKNREYYNEYQREYQRKWRKENPEKRVEYENRRWEKLADKYEKEDKERGKNE